MSGEKPLREQLVGTWKIISVNNTRPDGTIKQIFGPNIAVFDAHGNTAIILMRSDRPKFAANNRDLGTPEEFKTTVQGTHAYFGTYSVIEKNKTLVFHVEGNTFPNQEGIDTEREPLLPSSSGRPACLARPRVRSFFARDPSPREETPERAVADREAAARECSSQLLERDIRRLLDKREDQAGPRLNASRAPVAAQSLRPGVALYALQGAPADRARLISFKSTSSPGSRLNHQSAGNRKPFGSALIQTRGPSCLTR